MIPLRSLLSCFRTRKFLSFLVLVFSIVSQFFYTSTLKNLVSEWSLLDQLPGLSPRALQPKSTCSPREYAEGKWVWRPYNTRSGPLSKSNATDIAAALNSKMGTEPSAEMQKVEDILEFARFSGCASSRNVSWGLGVDKEEQWDKFPGAVEWEWVPGGRCGASAGANHEGFLREWKVEEVVRDLVEGGGWLLTGDSVTGNQFFSLSCLLYPHVLATPDYTKAFFHRAWPQHLYLNPSSPLLHHDDSTIQIKKLRLPKNFDIEKTPLVTFRRNDLLYSKEELEVVHRELHPEFYKANETFKLFGQKAVWTLSPFTYLDDIFLAPSSHYRTLVVSTAGHWTTNLFTGYEQPLGEEEDILDGAKRKEERQPVYGYDGILKFFEEVMERWVERVQVALESAAQPSSSAAGASARPGEREEATVNMRPRTVIVRAYLPGHEDCHAHRSAWQEIVPYKESFRNWGEIWRYNQVFENLLFPSGQQATDYKNIHYLPIDRPGRLRPDSHVSGDCLHIMAGAGVLEGWSHYIWHYITRELEVS